MEARRRVQPGMQRAAQYFDLTSGGAVADTALMETSEGVAVPEMLNGQ